MPLPPLDRLTSLLRALLRLDRMAGGGEADPAVGYHRDGLERFLSQGLPEVAASLGTASGDACELLADFFGRHAGERGFMSRPDAVDTERYFVPPEDEPRNGGVPAGGAGSGLRVGDPRADGPAVRAVRRRSRRSLAGSLPDGFVHKDLRGSLCRDLDRRLRERIGDLDEVERLDPEAVSARLDLLRAARRLGREIIDRISEVEETRKALLLKQKLVLRADWCLSLDRVPPRFYPEIAANVSQVAEWRDLIGIELGPADPTWLAREPHLVLDTRHFDEAFADRLMAGASDLDGGTTGLLVKGENLQAMTLLAPRLAGEIDLCCIDPPYNTGNDGFLYRDRYPAEVWSAMLRDRLVAARSLSRRTATLALSIDDAELHRAHALAESCYGTELAKLVWDRNRKNDARWFSVGHEYMLIHAADRAHLESSGRTFREPKEGLEQARAHYEVLLETHGEDWEAVRRGWLAWFSGIPVSDPRRRLRRYDKVGPRGPFRDDGNLSWPGGGGPRYEVSHPVTGRPVRVPSRGWVYPTPDRFWEEYARGRVVFGPDETTGARRAQYLFEEREQVMPSVFYSYAQSAAQDLAALLGGQCFDHPKDWRDIARVVRYLCPEGGQVLDFFAGSGTTGQAVLEDRREGRGDRRFVLVEMGEPFDAVLLPRLKKVAYASRWKGGAPSSRTGRAWR